MTKTEEETVPDWLDWKSMSDRGGIDDEEKVIPEQPVTSSDRPPRPHKHRKKAIIGGIVLLLLVVLLMGIGIGMATSKSGGDSNISNIEGSGNGNGNGSGSGTSTDQGDGVGVGVDTDTDKGKDKDTDTGNGGDNDGGDGGVTVPIETSFQYSMAYVNDVCTDSGSAECVEACVDSNCCLFPSEANPSSCLETQLENCLDYARCQILDSQVAPAPDNLHEICDPDTGSKEECISACADVTCCFLDDGEVESCVASSTLMCIDYGPCQNLRRNRRVPAPPENLGELCLSHNKRKECNEACSKAQCCNQVIGSCLQDEFINCLQYAPCGLRQLQGEKVPAPPNNLDEVCTLAKVRNEDMDQCEKACKAAECCTDTNEDNNCFLDDPIDCVGHIRCGLLSLGGGDLQEAPPDIQETCRWTKIREDGPDRDKCRKECSRADCCLSQNEEENCILDGNVFSCASYAYCGLLALPRDGSIDFPNEAAYEVCSFDNIEDSDGRDDCEALCQEEARCCFESNFDETCLTDNVPACAAWMIVCGKLGIFNAVQSSGVSQIQTQGFTLNSPSYEVKDACRITNRFSSNGRNECRQDCKPGRCCVGRGDDCLEGNELVCGEWFFFCGFLLGA